MNADHPIAVPGMVVIAGGKELAVLHTIVPVVVVNVEHLIAAPGTVTVVREKENVVPLTAVPVEGASADHPMAALVAAGNVALHMTVLGVSF